VNHNPCHADRERRERAVADSALVARDGPMERRIEFEVGYDHRAFPEACGGGGHGCHGMTLRFILAGPAGAVQWAAAMPNCYPGNVSHGSIAATRVGSIVPIEAPEAIGDGYATDLGYHSPAPHYDDQTRMDHCHLLPQGYCYYDGSALNAEPVLEAFLAHGPHAVWAALARYYSELFADAQVRA
jgi:hypothetical protein